MRTRTDGRAGMSLVEIAVAIAVLSLLVLLAVGAMNEASQPTIEAAVRAELTARGDATIVRIERELSSADFTNAAQVCGSWSASPSPAGTFTAASTGNGDVVQMFPITGWDTATDSITRGPAVIYAFRDTPGEGTDGADNDRDGLIDEMQLVRVDTTTGLAVVLLEDVLNNGTATVAERPEFTQVGFSAVPPQRAQLELRFTLSKRVGSNQFVTMTFAKVITLRNLM